MPLTRRQFAARVVATLPAGRLATAAMSAVSGAALGATSAAAQAPRPARVAVVCAVHCTGDSYDALRQTLRDLGRVEGQNLTLDVRGAEGRLERLPALLAEILAERPDVIVTAAPQPTHAAKQATTSVPIVMMFVADPVMVGLVPSLTRPGGNLTGVTTLPAGTFLGKQLDLLREMVPGASRVAVLWNSGNAMHRALLERDLVPAAERLGVTLQMLDVRSPDAIEPAVDAAVKQRAQALLAAGDPLFHRPANRVPDLALRARLPAIYLDREVAAAGGLLAYGPDFVALARRAAMQVDRILKGARPADIPIEQPTTFVLSINQKTARALGLTVPPSLLLRATEVFE